MYPGTQDVGPGPREHTAGDEMRGKKSLGADSVESWGSTGRQLFVQRPPTFSSPGIISVWLDSGEAPVHTEWSVQDKALACFRQVCFFPCLPGDQQDGA